MNPVTIIGGGLAGAEAAWRLARAGRPVRLHEMRPGKTTPAHRTDRLAELVCSNSFRAESETAAVGLLKREMGRLDSVVMTAAAQTRVPAGKALAVDREAFSKLVTEMVAGQPEVELIRGEITDLTAIDRPAIVAAGPLASDELTRSLAALTGDDQLHFYDAIAPIVEADSVDPDKSYWASRWADPAEEADYLNCPMTEDEYNRFYDALMAADKVEARDFEKPKYFEGCLPIEIMAQRGRKTLAFGPLKPVGLADPRTGEQAHAVVQLRREDAAGTYLNLVGFQTKLTHAAQLEVFRLIPALAKANFERLGSIHRNTFVNGPRTLNPDLSLKAAPDIFLAGQITGVEGYLESAACGLLAGEFLDHRLNGQPFDPPPPVTALGALVGYVAKNPTKKFQPSNVHFGLFPPLEKRLPKRQRGQAYADRAAEAMERWLRRKS